MKIGESKPGDDLWPHVCRLFPLAVARLDDPADGGHYHFFVATDDAGEFLGGCVTDVGPLRFGPLTDLVEGFLEDIVVLEPHRRRGVGTALMRAALDNAWQAGARHVRWGQGYNDLGLLAFYRSFGATFIPEEDPAAAESERCYTVVVVNPKVGRGSCGRV